MESTIYTFPRKPARSYKCPAYSEHVIYTMYTLLLIYCLLKVFRILYQHQCEYSLTNPTWVNVNYMYSTICQAYVLLYTPDTIFSISSRYECCVYIREGSICKCSEPTCKQQTTGSMLSSLLLLDNIPHQNRVDQRQRIISFASSSIFKVIQKQLLFHIFVIYLFYTCFILVYIVCVILVSSVCIVYCDVVSETHVERRGEPSLTRGSRPQVNFSATLVRCRGERLIGRISLVIYSLS